MLLFKKYSPFYSLTLFYIVVSLILRIILIVHPITQTSFKWFEILKIFTLGVISDFFVFVIAGAFLWIYLLFLSNSKFDKPWGYLIFGILCCLLVYVSFYDTILNEYGGVVPTLGIGFIALKTGLFGLLLFAKKYRAKIRLALYSITIFIFVLLIIQNAVSEYFFWNEFGVRYNFIAVDYLVYTNTVIGNIMESYPVIPLFTGIGIAATVISALIVIKSKAGLQKFPSFNEKIKYTLVYLGLFLISILTLPQLTKLQNSQNIFTNELASNGVYKFYSAFMNSELDYFKFYKTLPEEDAFAILDKQIPNIKGQNTLRQIRNTAAENHKNVILITIESFSADYMKAYGNKENLTPFLDSLATKSLLFTNLYAVGNRTVRGLEAVTLSLPPAAGESIVKREDNKDKFSTGSIFKQRGYDVKYLYGGDAFFDNMEDFFSGNSYDIVDEKMFKPNEITFKNIWGVCDEDLFNKAIKVMNAEAKANKPFFNHIMTVSNHRPYTYPNDRIDIAGDLKSREGAVKYTDFAIKKFFEKASKEAWFANTVFVILADHCASSSGKTTLPLDKYRIPAMIYGANFIEPQKFTPMMSQIDVMPTLFGLLNFSYQSKFYGQDVLKPDYKPRALIATYQNLGLIKDNILTIISPVRQSKQFQLTLTPKPGIGDDFQLYYDEKPLVKERLDLINETISYYQTQSSLLKDKKYQKTLFKAPAIGYVP